jgi:hypothetical protein
MKKTRNWKAETGNWMVRRRAATETEKGAKSRSLHYGRDHKRERGDGKVEIGKVKLENGGRKARGARCIVPL